MAKDPAALFYIANFLTATAEMKADCTGWYVRLILHQYDKKSLPNDIEELANLANVRASEFEVFQHVFQHVLKQRFTVLPTNRLVDYEAAEIIRSREAFVDKRSFAGRKSAFMKFIRKELCQDEAIINYIKDHVEPEQIPTTDQHVFKQVYEHMFQVYININIVKNRIDVDIGGPGEKDEEREEPPNWHVMPGEAHLNLELPAIKAGSARQLMFLTGIKATEQQVLDLWGIFKVQNFTGKKFYSSPDEAYSHFINWSKSQKINGKTDAKHATNGKSAGAIELLQQLGSDIAAG